MDTLKIMLAAGEASGDLHGANLARELQQSGARVQLFGMGGKLMREAGVELLFDPTRLSTIGFAEALRSVRILYGVLRRLGRELEHRQPDVLVLIDFPGFNMRLGRIASRVGVPVVYFFSPAAWAWGRGRAKKVAGFATKVASVFPFEYDVYRKAGADAEFVGHPLLDIVRVTKSREEICRQVGYDPHAPVFGLLPGSRDQELRVLFPIMLEAARRLQAAIPAVQFLVPAAHTVSDRVLTYATGAGVKIRTLQGETYNVLAACDAAVIACGTATLEAAIIGTPFAAIYRVSGATYVLAKRLVKIQHFALPNIVMGREVVPELIQDQATPANVAKVLLELWKHPARIRQMQEDFAVVRSRLGRPGAVRRAARLVIDVAQQHRLAGKEV